MKMVSTLVLLSGAVEASDWDFWSPREETRPESVRVEDRLEIRTSGGMQEIGCWRRSFPVEGGDWYRFTARATFEGVETPRRSIVSRVLWRDTEGKPVWWQHQAPGGFRRGESPRAEAEYPLASLESTGEMTFAHELEAPEGAVQAVVELYLQWAPQGSVGWTGVSLQAIEAPTERMVRLAAVHHRPVEGSSREEKLAQFEPLIADAAGQEADLIVLPECLTYYRSGKTLAECAEPVPGPSTAFFGKLAAQHDCYIVAGLIERDGEVCYNTAALLGPSGELEGKYRKVCLPRGEIEAGLTPGDEYPVFDTRFGKLGMMVCYDGFFPEVARELKKNGAEVVAWPVWGCNPLLGQARAAENELYLVSSTYTDVADDWMVSAVFDPYGQIQGRCEEWGSVSVTPVDLNRSPRWVSLGNFGDQLPSHRPRVVPEPGVEDVSRRP